MTRQEAKELLERVENGTCTADEKLLVDSWYLEMTRQAKDFSNDIDYESEKLWIWNQLQKGKVRRLPVRLVVAACLTFFMLGFGAYLFVTHKNSHPVAELASKDILPGTNKAILTLANGKRIDLNAQKNGNIASLPGVTVQKMANGKVIYRISSDNGVDNSEPVAYNTISTPNGGQYEIILPDGTDVYLNAASSLIYPTRFAGNDRTVTLSGEAYFEVSKNPKKPFFVKSTNYVEGGTAPQQIIRVLGTHFNVSCYPDEPITTTLAEGKIEISQPANPQRATLKPGDQSIVVSSNKINVHQVNVEDAVGWKNGLFVFNRTPLKEVMKQIGRWYDVEIDFTNLPNEPFEGEILRNNTLSQVLNVIERTNNLKFKVQGRRINISINH